MKKMNPELAEALAKLEEAQQGKWPDDLKIDGYKLVCTSIACPEQYDVFNEAGSRVGYLRLRHGRFRADCPSVGGDAVYESHPEGDGIFNDEERIPEITKALEGIKKYWEGLVG
jgi:hypothetical protein